MPKSRAYVSSSSSSYDTDEEVKQETSKKNNKRQAPEKREKPASEKREKPAPSKKAKHEPDEDEDSVWELGNNRRVTVREFKGNMYVDIREMYLDKSGDMKPGKKGIALNMVQWRKFVSLVEEIDRVAKSKC
ncbi:activated RNA polymerase II transcriptional coactivator p15 [Cephus cinctus]|uniref:Activated RNA polymerase II transcriptional coactivator p15 n=1 Tax=Cephus cinctus TaxID=211228 RepID=A0AAJ7RDK7_CEPCN|nr:activated RNA polymerase II transcriptional coactivator p15 [Cephus cinctus]XP_024938445.1 activated RNA polymerase II transcriptional coactivator p15 [Cephus cinctus]XP_024938446.1 activated RNA polymerase II transcriptional coactivator p15 [Cephus cinctus]